jgi:hypothetical protein
MSDKEGNADASDDLPLDDDLDLDEGDKTDGIVLDEGDDALEELEEEDDIDFGDEDEDAGKGDK